MSDTIEELYQQLISLGISEEELEKKVKNKVEEYGGFMSTQGILFMIAREKGLELRSPEIDGYFYDQLEEEIDYDEFTIDISEVQEGMTNIVLLGKILSVQDIREFARKDQSIGKVCSFFLSDSTATLKIVLWDEQVNKLNRDYFIPDELVRIVGGYAKLGRNENIEVHLGKKGALILSPEVSGKKRDQLGLVSIANSKIIPSNNDSKPLRIALQQNKYVNVAKGTVIIEEFKELELKSGDKSFLLSILLESEESTVRVKAWGMQAVECLQVINDGDTVSITNLAVRENKYTGEKELSFTKNSTLIRI